MTLQVVTQPLGVLHIITKSAQRSSKMRLSSSIIPILQKWTDNCKGVWSLAYFKTKCGRLWRTGHTEIREFLLSHNDLHLGGFLHVSICPDCRLLQCPTSEHSRQARAWRALIRSVWRCFGEFGHLSWGLALVVALAKILCCAKPISTVTGLSVSFTSLDRPGNIS